MALPLCRQEAHLARVDVQHVLADHRDALGAQVVEHEGWVLRSPTLMVFMPLMTGRRRTPWLPCCRARGAALDQLADQQVHRKAAVAAAVAATVAAAIGQQEVVHAADVRFSRSHRQAAMHEPSVVMIRMSSSCDEELARQHLHGVVLEVRVVEEERGLAGLARLRPSGAPGGCWLAALERAWRQGVQAEKPFGALSALFTRAAWQWR